MDPAREALADQRVVAVSAGLAHSLALTADGAVWSWGYGAFGRLGHGDQQSQPLPKKIEAFAGRRVVAVSAGVHSLATGVAVAAAALRDDFAVVSIANRRRLPPGSSLCARGSSTPSPPAHMRQEKPVCGNPSLTANILRDIPYSGLPPPSGRT